MGCLDSLLQVCAIPNFCLFLGPWPSLSQFSLWPKKGQLGHLQSGSCQMSHILLNLILSTWPATQARVPHGLSQRLLVSSYEPPGTFPVGWLVQLASRGQKKACLPPRRIVLGILGLSPKEPGSAGVSSQALRMVAGRNLRPQWPGQCLWLWPSLEAQAPPPEVQPSSGSVGEWKQLDPYSQTSLGTHPSATPC